MTITRSPYSACPLSGRIWMLCLLLSAGPAQAKMRLYTLLELAEQSDTVFVGTVTVVGTNTASMTVADVLCGNPGGTSISVTPVQIEDCVGRFVNFGTNELALVLGKRTDGAGVVIAGHGYGKIKLAPETRVTIVEATRRLLAIAPLGEREKNRAMLNLVRDPNDRLRIEARQYVVARIAGSELRDEYRDDLVALIRDADPEIQRAGLQGLQFVRAPVAIPRMAELSRSANANVASAASMTLAQYDTPESTAALIALTRHADPQLRIRACIDLDRSQRPEAREALVRLLDDPDPKVRAVGPRGLVYWLRRNAADEALPRLLELLNDEDPAVRASAADQLGECRRSALVPPLLAKLKTNGKDDPMNLSLLRALYCHYSKGDADARAPIDAEIGFVAAALTNGGPGDMFGPSFHAVGILSLSPDSVAREALKWASRSHPNAEIRAYAQRCLAR